MSTYDVMTHAYEEKIDAQLQQAKAQLGEFEARAKGKKAFERRKPNARPHRC
jgi:hypothetical protein